MTNGYCCSDLAIITRGGPHSTVTQLGDILSCESSFLGVHMAQGVTFWVPTHAPKPLVTRFESVSTFLSYPAPGYPWAWHSHESYLSQGPLWGDMGTSRVRLLSIGVRTMALKPHFSLLYRCFCARRAGSPHGDTPSMVFPTHGYWGVTLLVSCLGDALSWRRLAWATPYLGDAMLRRCPSLATPCPGDALLNYSVDFLSLTPSQGLATCWPWPRRWLLTLRYTN